MIIQTRCQIQCNAVVPMEEASRRSPLRCQGASSLLRASSFPASIARLEPTQKLGGTTSHDASVLVGGCLVLEAATAGTAWSVEISYSEFSRAPNSLHPILS